jgi:uncharacterized protein YyaL (SSP411 family)
MASDEANQLGLAASPYLRQHADNPVWWRPWGRAALDQARERDRLLLVSIGYSTCHWCHVMAHESFEHPAIAELMNQHFVNVKVDREEHPEVDEIYMEACQAMTGHGGWPLNAICTPDGVPLFVGTYFPSDRWIELLQSLARAWREDRPHLGERARQIRAFLDRAAQVEREPVGDALPALLTAIDEAYDAQDPGYGPGERQAPKFPPSNLLLCLLALDGRGLLSEEQGQQHVVAVLEAMQDSGLHDRVGGGFHRYSVDAGWRVPHFEKMLYDNALLMTAYALASQRFARADFLRTARGIGDYLLRDLRCGGEAAWGLATAEDADDPLGEGAFYAWSPTQLRELLADEAELLISDWDLAQETASFNRSGHGEPVIGHIPHPRGSEAFQALDPAGREAHRLAWEPLLPRLREARSTRARPGRDDKCLTDLNGLALQGFAVLARLSGEARYAEACRGLSRFVQQRMLDHGLLRLAGRPAYISDYGHALLGFTAAYDALGEAWLIGLALTVAEEAVARLRDPEDGAFFTTPPGRADLIRRSKEFFDGPAPSGQNALALGFVRLWQLTGEARWRGLAEGILAASATPLQRAPQGLSTLVCAQQLLAHGAVELVVAGPPAEAEELLRLARILAPWEARIVPAWSAPDWPLLEGRRDLTRPQTLVCVGQHCLLPALSAEELLARLRELRD